jgi:hypothetical protein
MTKQSKTGWSNARTGTFMKGHYVASPPTNPHLSTNVKRHCISPTNRPTAVREARASKSVRWFSSNEMAQDKHFRLPLSKYLRLAQKCVGFKICFIVFGEVCSKRASSRQVRHKLRSICAEKRVLRSSRNVFDTTV